MKKLLEVCVDHFLSAKIAAENGADRIELCSSLALEGLTPSYGFMSQARNIPVPIYAMIRPRAGDFIYDMDEIAIMHEDIRMAKKAGLDGVVLGCLNNEGGFHAEAMKSLCQTAQSCDLPITAHRAFDQVKKPIEALDFLIDLEIERLLTSGQKSKALEGMDLIAQLVERSQNRLSIMAGSGVRLENMEEILNKTNVPELHFSAKASNEIANITITKNKDDKDVSIVSAETVGKARKILDGWKKQ